MARLDEEFEARWHREAEAVMSGMKEWRLQHPKATFREIESAVDEKLSGMRARLLEDLALASRAADLQDKQLGEHPRCPDCGQVLESQGKQARTVLTHGGGEVHLKRDYARCPACGAGLFPSDGRRGIRRSRSGAGASSKGPTDPMVGALADAGSARTVFPLDEELQLLPGPLSPRLQEDLVHLSTWMPFERAATELAYFTRVEVSDTSVRHHTEVAGAAYVAVQTAELERLEGERPQGPAGPEVLQVSADGAMVPLVGGQWAEVKTVAVGRVEVVTNRDGVPEAHARDLRYFSRLADAETFTREAWVELHAGGTASAQTVCGVMDGADWEQTFLDVHRADAIRILDFPHAVEYLTKAAQATWCLGATTADSWVQEQAHILKHDEHGAVKVLKALAHLPIEQAADPIAARQARQTALNYLTKRLDQIQYATFQAQGFPIGSGSVESANKLVVEARLKGSGMHWARSHVNPLVALRTIACSDRWAEAWPRIERHLRDQVRQRRLQRQRARRAVQIASCTNPVPARPNPSRSGAPRPKPPIRSPRMVNGRPTADHPWKKHPLLPGGRRALVAQPKL